MSGKFICRGTTQSIWAERNQPQQRLVLPRSTRAGRQARASREEAAVSCPYLTMRALLLKIVPFLKERALPSPITALALSLWR